jgi:hypothetical protein
MSGTDSTYAGVVIGIDPSRVDSAAMAVAIALGEITGSIELLTVIPIGVPRDTYQVDLEQIAGAAGLSQAVCTVASWSEPSEVLLDAAGHDRLLIVGCAPGHPALAPRLGDVGRTVLRNADVPIMVIGPSVPARFESTAELVVCAHGAPADAAMVAASRWAHTFNSPRTWVAEVIPTSTDVTGEGALTVADWARGLGLLGVDAHQRLLSGGDTVTWLEHFSSDLENAVYVVASTRYTDGRRHLHSTTRELIARGRHPVLVAPAVASELVAL